MIADGSEQLYFSMPHKESRPPRSRIRIVSLGFRREPQRSQRSRCQLVMPDMLAFGEASASLEASWKLPRAPPARAGKIFTPILVPRMRIIDFSQSCWYETPDDFHRPGSCCVVPGGGYCAHVLVPFIDKRTEIPLLCNGYSTY